MTETWPDWFGPNAINPNACKSLNNKFDIQLEYYLVKLAAQMGLPDKVKFSG